MTSIGFWNNEVETGHAGNVKMTIIEDDALLAEITGPTPEEVITTALCLMQGGYSDEDSNDPMAVAISRCAEIMNDAGIMVAEMAHTDELRRES